VRLTPPNHTKRAFFIQVPEKTSNRNAPFSFIRKHCQSVGDGIAFADGAPWHFLFAEGKATGACRAEKLTEVLWG